MPALNKSLLPKTQPCAPQSSQSDPAGNLRRLLRDNWGSEMLFLWWLLIVPVALHKHPQINSPCSAGPAATHGLHVLQRSAPVPSASVTTVTRVTPGVPLPSCSLLAGEHTAGGWTCPWKSCSHSWKEPCDPPVPRDDALHEGGTEVAAILSTSHVHAQTPEDQALPSAHPGAKELNGSSCSAGQS